MLRLWGHDSPFPYTPDKVRCLGATLRAGRYRSFRNYFNVLNVAAEREGAIPDVAATRRAVIDAIRSCGRGLGEPKQSDGLPLELLATLPDRRDALASGGPMYPKHVCILGTWFLTREIEASNARLGDVTFLKSTQGLVRIAWKLPASKTDQAATGVERGHGCSCGRCRWGHTRDSLAAAPDDDIARVLCPVRVAAFHLLQVAQECHLRQVPCHAGLPLFPDALLGPATKAGVVATIEAVAHTLGFELVGRGGARRFTGHALRAGGSAVTLARRV